MTPNNFFSVLFFRNGVPRENGEHLVQFGFSGLKQFPFLNFLRSEGKWCLLCRVSMVTMRVHWDVGRASSISGKDCALCTGNGHAGIRTSANTHPPYYQPPPLHLYPDTWPTHLLSIYSLTPEEDFVKVYIFCI